MNVFENANHIPNEKKSELYLDQISGNSDEKFGNLAELVLNDELPLVNGKINILELGTGGGETMNKLKDIINSKSNVNFFGLDAAHLFVKKYEGAVNHPGVVADAAKLPFKSASISALNASAIFHEISTYGIRNGNEIIQGIPAIEVALKEAIRVLVPGGILMYRDIYCPNDRLDVKEVSYRNDSWKFFIEKYLPKYISSAEKIFPEVLRGLKIENLSNGEVLINASAQVHREIQRHYITFRDYIRKIISKEMGLDIMNSAWTNKREGDKNFSLRLRGESLEMYYGYMGLDNAVKKSNVLEVIMNSDEYDDYTDYMIKVFFENNSEKMWDDWLRREGSELYTYLSIDELVALFNNLNKSTDIKSIKIKKIARNYYIRYLDRAISNPEYEGKQIVQFKK